jgi:pyridoxal phosphate enzyme (YggS family)
MPNFQQNIIKIRARIQTATNLVNRDSDEICLLAVSKTRSAEDVAAAAACGIFSFGENYLQEASTKIQALEQLTLEWHFIGPLQSNKTRSVAENFAWVHSVDRLKIAQRLNDQRPTSLGPLNICLQVNIDEEPSKSGLMLDEVKQVALTMGKLPNLRLRGLMAIPKSRQGLQAQREPFRKLRLLRDEINIELDNSQKLDTLSMGMSDDIEAAIYEGATIVRVGTGVFGPRHN